MIPRNPLLSRLNTVARSGLIDFSRSGLIDFLIDFVQGERLIRSDSVSSATW